jgi:hypothetical protein
MFDVQIFLRPGRDPLTHSHRERQAEIQNGVVGIVTRLQVENLDIWVRFPTEEEIFLNS